MRISSRSSSPIPIKKARIEIIPLIDIMFFLLAAFMLVSLTMINMKGIEVNLPTATSAQPNSKPNFNMVSIDALMDKHHLDAIVAPSGGPAWLTDLVNGDHDIVGSVEADCAGGGFGVRVHRVTFAFRRLQLFWRILTCRALLRTRP